MLTLADRNRHADLRIGRLNKKRLAKACARRGCCVYRWSSATEPTLTRSELITELAASNPHLLKADVELIVATVFDRLTDALVRGDRVELRGFGILALGGFDLSVVSGRVELRGFGTFTVKRRNARIGRNPRTGEPVPVDEKARPFFKTGRELRERLNRGGMKPSRAPMTAAAPAAASSLR